MVVTIGGLSKRTGVHIETIRYYEKIGLMPEPGRSRGGHRQYESEHVARLHFIHRSRELGFSIDDIRRLLDLADKDPAPCREALQLTKQHREQIRRKIADLQRLDRTLDDIARACEDSSTGHCPIIDSFFFFLAGLAHSAG